MTEDVSESNGRALALRAASRARDKLRDVQRLLASIRDEVAGDRFWRYQRNVSPGLQEYIEALSFAHYLEQGTLISYEEVLSSLCDEHGVLVRSVSSPVIEDNSMAVPAVLSSPSRRLLAWSF